MQHGTVIQVEPGAKRFIVRINDKAYALWECPDSAGIEVGSRHKGLLYKIGPAVLHHLQRNYFQCDGAHWRLQCGALPQWAGLSCNPHTTPT